MSNQKFRSFKTGSYNKLFDKLSQDIQKQATEAFKKWKEDPNNVMFKPLAITNNVVWSAQVNTKYRALAKKDKDESGQPTYTWFWVGSHEDYNNVIKKLDHVKHIQSTLGKMRSPGSEFKKTVTPN